MTNNTPECPELSRELQLATGHDRLEWSEADGRCVGVSDAPERMSVSQMIFQGFDLTDQSGSEEAGINSIDPDQRTMETITVIGQGPNQSEPDFSFHNATEDRSLFRRDDYGNLSIPLTEQERYVLSDRSIESASAALFEGQNLCSYVEAGGTANSFRAAQEILSNPTSIFRECTNVEGSEDLSTLQALGADLMGTGPRDNGLGRLGFNPRNIDIDDFSNAGSVCTERFGPGDLCAGVGVDEHDGNIDGRASLTWRMQLGGGNER